MGNKGFVFTRWNLLNNLLRMNLIKVADFIVLEFWVSKGMK
jgi:hypothetical protein